jgi:hypothetical protein
MTGVGVSWKLSLQLIVKESIVSERTQLKTGKTSKVKSEL